MASDKLVVLPDEPQIDVPGEPARKVLHRGNPGFNKALLDRLGRSPVFAVERHTCAACGHQHATAPMGGICVGCPCVGCPCEERS